MSQMADPMIVLRSLQRAMDDGMSVGPNELESGYKMFYDEPFIGGKRFSFAKVVGCEVQALSIFGLEDPIDGITCYNVGCAVKESLRRGGLAGEAISKGLDKLKNELRRAGVKSFYLEAVIDVTNTPSVKGAEKLFCSTGVPIVERESERRALHFKKLIYI